MIFETDRLYVRKWKQTDLKSLHQLYSDTAITEDISPELTIEETKRIFNAQLLQYNIDECIGRYLIIEKISGAFVGTFLLRKTIDRSGVEIGYAFRKEDWGKGFATEIVKQGVQYVFTYTGFSSIYAFTEIRNDGSKNVLDKSGFSYLENIIEDGEELDVFFMTSK
jgi:ribosomal-protein-alanine N-acetyltransferase